MKIVKAGKVLTSESLNAEIIVNDNNRTVAEGIRQDNETNRVAAEIVRESQEQSRIDTFNTNETNRQSEFDVNEANRISEFDTNELNRETNETTRVNAENIRIGNENDRVSNENTRDLNEIVREQFKHLGEYNSTLTYLKNNLVIYNGSSFVALQDVPIENYPDPTLDTAYWQRVALHGDIALEPRIVSAETEIDDINLQITDIDTVIDNHSLEITQARIEEDGTTNTTIKARLDKKEAENVVNLDAKVNITDIGSNLKLVQTYSSTGGTFTTTEGKVYLVLGVSSSSSGNSYIGYVLGYNTGVIIVDVHKGAYASVVGSGNNVVFSNSGGYVTNWRIYTI